MTSRKADIGHVLRLERELQLPSVRSDVERLTELLAPGFIEIGVSGRRWERGAILDLLARESEDPDAGEIGMSGLEARVLTADVIQVFWDSERDGHRARRMSLWQRTEKGWQQTYHQGTPLH